MDTQIKQLPLSHPPLHDGRKVRIEGDTYIITERSGSQLVLKSEATDELRLETAQAVMDLVNRGLATIMCRTFDNSLIERVYENLAHASPPKSKDEEKALRRQAEYIRDAFSNDPRTNEAWKASIRDTASRIGEPGRPPCRKTVQSWRKIAQALGNRMSGYHPSTNSRGRKSSINDEHNMLMIENHCTYFLKLERPTYNYAFEKYQSAVRTYNATKLKELRITPVSLWTYKRHLQASFHPRTIHAKRFGEKAAREHWRTLNKGPEMDRILEKVVLDSTPADMMVIDTHGTIKARPWITAAIDAYSRCILAVVISFVPPSIENLSQCLRLAIRPKSHIFGEYGLPGDGASGFPRAVLVDNALEYHADFLRSACTQLNIVLEFQPKGEPWWKGMVERWFGTLAKEIHTLPGTTFSNIQERGDYNSDEHACMTLDQLRKHVWTWVEKYHHSPHSELPKPPAVMWQECADRENERPMRDIRELDLFLIDTGERTIGRNGIKFEGLHYDSNLLSSYKVGPQETRKAEIKHDHADISRIWVRPAGAHQFIEVPAVWSRYTDGIGLFEHRRIKQNKSDNDKKAWTEDEFIARRDIYLQMIEEYRENKKAPKWVIRAIGEMEDTQAQFTDRDLAQTDLAPDLIDPLEMVQNQTHGDATEAKNPDGFKHYSIQKTEPRNHASRVANKTKPIRKKPPLPKPPKLDVTTLDEKQTHKPDKFSAKSQSVRKATTFADLVNPFKTP